MQPNHAQEALLALITEQIEALVPAIVDARLAQKLSEIFSTPKPKRAAAKKSTAEKKSSPAPSESNGATAAKPSRVSQEDAIAAVCAALRTQTEAVSSELLVTETQLKPLAVRRALAVLVERGTVQKEGNARATKYRWGFVTGDAE